MLRVQPRPLLIAIALTTAFAVGGCAGARPYERELLADPIMDFAVESGSEARELKWLEAREGSLGGVGGAGGGCACK
ncbi:DUF4266 domain-containing protein [bacterium]|nr:DUF4266 domain-containing protein [bacterium]